MSRARAAVPLLISLALAGCAPFNDAGGRYLPNTALEKARQEHAAAAASFTNAIRRYCSVRYETDGGRQACQVEKQREMEERLRSRHEPSNEVVGLYAARPGATGSSLRCQTARGQTDCERPRSTDADALRKQVLLSLGLTV